MGFTGVLTGCCPVFQTWLPTGFGSPALGFGQGWMKAKIDRVSVPVPLFSGPAVKAEGEFIGHLLYARRKDRPFRRGQLVLEEGHCHGGSRPSQVVGHGS